MTNCNNWKTEETLTMMVSPLPHVLISSWCPLSSMIGSVARRWSRANWYHWKTVETIWSIYLNL